MTERFASTQVPVSRSKTQIDTILERYGVEAAQWTSWKGLHSLRFRLDGQTYLFKLPEMADDPRETRRLFRVLHWYLDGVFAAQAAGFLEPKQAFLGYVEVTPESTMAEIMEAKQGIDAMKAALGVTRLALDPGGDDG